MRRGLGRRNRHPRQRWTSPFLRSVAGPRGARLYYCFDLLWLEGEDLRNRALVVRKQILKSILPTTSASDALLYADHIEERGIDFFRLVCQRDLEGIVAKKKLGVYGEAWFNIRNPVYSHYAGRRELFERRYLLRCVSVTGHLLAREYQNRAKSCHFMPRFAWFSLNAGLFQLKLRKTLPGSIGFDAQKVFARRAA